MNHEKEEDRLTRKEQKNQEKLLKHLSSALVPSPICKTTTSYHTYPQQQLNYSQKIHKERLSYSLQIQSKSSDCILPHLILTHHRLDLQSLDQGSNQHTWILEKLKQFFLSQEDPDDSSGSNSPIDKYNRTFDADSNRGK
jgi:hypothetical protein